MLSLVLVASLICQVSCSLPDQGGGNDGGAGNQSISYGAEYLHVSGDMGTNTRLTAGKADIITDKRLIFTADVTSFDGLRIGHGYEEDGSSYVEIDDTFIKQYTNGVRLKYDVHSLNIKESIKVTIDVDEHRVATVMIESSNDSFTFTTDATWYGTSGDIFAESLGSALTGAQLAFTADGYKSDVQFYGDSYLSQSSTGWLRFALDDGYTDALFDGCGERDSEDAFASLIENLEHSSPKTVVWMMGMNDGEDSGINTPSVAWVTYRDKLIALSKEHGFEIVFATVPTVPTRYHEAKNRWIRESGYGYVDIADALGADGTGKWEKNYLKTDGVHPTLTGAYAIYRCVMNKLYNIEADTLGIEYKQTNGDMGADTKLSLGVSDVNTDKHLIFTADVVTFVGLRVGHGHSSYTSDYIEINPTYLRHYQRMSDTKMLRQVEHGLDIKGSIRVTIDTGTDNSATINIESNGKSYTITVPTWYGCSGEIFAESQGSELTDAHLAFTCDGYKDDIHFYGDSYIFVWSAGRWPYYAFNEGYAQSALYDGYGGRASGSAYKSLAENLKHSAPKTVVWMMGMNDGGDPNINTPCSDWSIYRDKLIALSEEYGFEIVFATIPTVPTRYHEAKNKWIRESGYRYIDVAAGLGADGTGKWCDGYLSGDGVHPSARGGEAIFRRIVADLPEYTKSRDEK